MAQYRIEGDNITFNVLPGILMEDGMSDELNIQTAHETNGQKERRRVGLERGQVPKTITLQVAGEIIKKLKHELEK